MLDQKVRSVRHHFQRLMGYRLKRYETAETCFNNEWFPDPSLPFRLFVDEDRLVSVLWDLDRLWIARDRELPSGTESPRTRWTADSLRPLNSLIGGILKSVRLGPAQMSAGGQEITIGTRLFIEVDDWWLEIFSAQHGNGYAVLSMLPLGDTILCVDHCDG
jgi:hypothetical protein